MLSTLPILVPGRSTPISVPCELPDSFTFAAYLPSRGLREFTAWLTSTDPREAEVADVLPVKAEKSPRMDEWALNEDEQRRADEAAGDVLELLLHTLGFESSRKPYVIGTSNPMCHIALAHEAECKAWETVKTALVATNGSALGFYDANPATERSSNGWVSKSANILARYVDRCLEEALAAQRIKAEKQQAERGGDEAASGSELSGF